METMKTRFPRFIITSSYQKYAIESIKYEVVDYLLKPIELENLATTYKKGKRSMAKERHYPKNNYLKNHGNLIGIKYEVKIKF